MSGDRSKSGQGLPDSDESCRDGSSHWTTSSSNPKIRLPCAVIDPARSESTHLSDAEIAQRFLGDYLALLAERAERVRRHVRAFDTTDAVVVLRSLETSSQMANAADVVAAAQALRMSIEEQGSTGMEPLLAALLTAVEATRKRLSTED